MDSVDCFITDIASAKRTRFRDRRATRFRASGFWSCAEFDELRLALAPDKAPHGTRSTRVSKTSTLRSLSRIALASSTSFRISWLVAGVEMDIHFMQKHLEDVRHTRDTAALFARATEVVTRD